MSGGVYGGDEVGALVMDVGSCTTRAGWAGEDSPRVDVPSVIGHAGDNSYVGTNRLHLVREGMKLSEPIVRDGIINDWDSAELLFNYVYKDVLQCDSSQHPILLSEPAWNSSSARDKAIELFFETFQVPAFMLCNSAVLAAFAHGRSSALVLDSGAQQTVAVPVHEGFALKQAVVKSPLAGDFISSQCRQSLLSNGLEPIPIYMVGSRGDSQTGAGWKKKQNLPTVADSYHEFMVRELMQDVSASVLQVIADPPYDEDTIAQMPGVGYDFPNGHHYNFAEHRFRIAEGLFEPQFIQLPNDKELHAMMSMSGVVTTAIGMCDIDLRPHLYSNIVTVGGNSLILGFTERLNRDLSTKVPGNIKIKIIASSGTAERRFGTWIGGSILASLGSFHQMWISRQEYEEHGKTMIAKKCV